MRKLLECKNAANLNYGLIGLAREELDIQGVPQKTPQCLKPYKIGTRNKSRMSFERKSSR